MMGYAFATRVLAPLCAAALLAVPAGIALGSSHARAATAVPTTPPKPGTTSAVVQACHVGLLPADRYAVFSAQMAAIQSTTSMAVRFDLYGATASTGTRTGTGTRNAPGPFKHLSAPTLGTWNRSAAGVTIGAFRAVVRYRWYGHTGLVIRRARRITSVCAEPDQRPNLVAGAVTHQPVSAPRT